MNRFAFVIYSEGQTSWCDEVFCGMGLPELPSLVREF